MSRDRLGSRPATGSSASGWIIQGGLSVDVADATCKIGGRSSLAGTQPDAIPNDQLCEPRYANSLFTGLDHADKGIKASTDLFSDDKRA